MASNTETFSITLSSELAAKVRARIEPGIFETESDVIEALLGADLADDFSGDPAFEAWMREECLPTLERIDAGTEKMYTAEEALEQLEIRRTARG